MLTDRNASEKTTVQVFQMRLVFREKNVRWCKVSVPFKEKQVLIGLSVPLSVTDLIACIRSYYIKLLVPRSLRLIHLQLTTNMKYVYRRSVATQMVFYL